MCSITHIKRSFIPHDLKNNLTFYNRLVSIASLVASYMDNVCFIGRGMSCVIKLRRTDGSFVSFR